LNNIISNLRIFCNQTSILWISGLGISILFLIRLTLDLGNEKSDWIQYYCLVFIFPLLLLLFTVKSNDYYIILIKILLSLIFIFFGIYYFFDPNMFIISTVTAIALFSYWKEYKNSSFNYIYYLSGFVLLTISWFFSFKLYWWNAPEDRMFYNRDTYLIFFFAILIVHLIFFQPSWIKTKKIKLSIKWENTFLYLKFAIVFAVFLFASLSYGSLDIHHWGCFVGPAQLVRQGGWLLWSVPSQYGFLSILSIAIFPMKSCWQSFYILMCSFHFATALIIFYTIYSFRENILNYFLAIFLTISSLFLFPGWLPLLVGVQTFPSIGPYRFFWIFALLFFIFIQYKKNFIKSENKKNILGTCIWLIGFLWSFESAFYVSAIWFPYLLINSMNYSSAEYSSKNIFSWVRKAFLDFSIPVFTFLFFILCIFAFYYFRLGELPDVESFYEHALSFKEGFGSFIINGMGSVTVALLAIFIICSSISQNLLDFRKNKEKIAILGALYFGLLASLTYYISRSHEQNISNLIPIIIFALAIVISLEKEKPILNYYLLAILPLYVIVLTLTYGNPSFLAYIKGLNGYSTAIEKVLPKNEIAKVLMNAGIKVQDPICLLDDKILITGKDDLTNQEHSYWLPLNPCTILTPLPLKRINTYIKRFSAQFKSGGYLINNKPYNMSEAFKKIILKYYTPVQTLYDDNNWQIEKYILNPDYLPDMVNNEILQIKANKEWYASIKEKASLNKIAVEEQLYRDAIFMLETRNELDKDEIEILEKQLMLK
jgi:hypothetical protein